MKKILNYIRARFRKWLNEEIWLEDYIKAGLKIGKHVSIQPGVVFDISHAWLIELEDGVGLAPHVYILAHDVASKKDLGYTKIGKVLIKKNARVGARSIILPGVTIGENSFIAAGSVVHKDIPSNEVWGGNPIRFICKKDDFLNKRKSEMQNAPIFDVSYTIRGGLNNHKKEEMIHSISKIGFIR